MNPNDAILQMLRLLLSGEPVQPKAPNPEQEARLQAMNDGLAEVINKYLPQLKEGEKGLPVDTLIDYADDLVAVFSKMVVVIGHRMLMHAHATGHISSLDLEAYLRAHVDDTAQSIQRRGQRGVTTIMALMIKEARQRR